MKPGPKPLLGVPMTQAERQARYGPLLHEVQQSSATADRPTAAAGHSGGMMRWLN